MKKFFKRAAATVTALSVLAAAVVFDVPGLVKALAAGSGEHTEHKICAGSSCTDSSHTDITDWVGINDLSSLETGKHYYLTEDITLGNAADGDTESQQSAIEIAGKDITLCLNGHTISIQEGVQARIFYIKNNGSLTLCDCQETGKLTGGNVSGSGSAVYVLSGMYSGSFAMYGGTISGNTASSYGGGVYLHSGTFEMNGGTILNNGKNSNSDVTTTNGGGVFVHYGTFKMTDGTISNNTASSNGAGVFSNGTFTMDGGTISGNTASSGGGVYLNGDTNSYGTFTMNSGTIMNNEAGLGGGVYSYNSIFNMDGGTISGNTAKNYGGGLVVNGRKSTMNGGTISNNTAATSGGGVFIVVGVFEISGGTISNNTATEYYGGGVYVNGGTGTFEISSGEISGNEATGHGGGVYNFERILPSVPDRTSESCRSNGRSVRIFTEQTERITPKRKNSE